MKPFFKSKIGAICFALSSMVVPIILLLAFLGPTEPRFPRRALETVLSIDLCTMRDAIDNYTADKQKPPNSLDDLATEHYLREIPVDPTTGKKDWVVKLDDVMLSPRSQVRGIANVRSNSGLDAGCTSSRDIWLQ